MYLLAPPALPAQEEPAAPGLSACVFVVSDLSDSAEYAQFQEIIRAQLEMELQNAGLELIEAPRWQAARDTLGYSDRDILETPAE